MFSLVPLQYVRTYIHDNITDEMHKAQLFFKERNLSYVVTYFNCRMHLSNWLLWVNLFLLGVLLSVSRAEILVVEVPGDEERHEIYIPREDIDTEKLKELIELRRSERQMMEEGQNQEEEEEEEEEVAPSATGITSYSRDSKQLLGAR